MDWGTASSRCSLGEMMIWGMVAHVPTLFPPEAHLLAALCLLLSLAILSPSLLLSLFSIPLPHASSITQLSAIVSATMPPRQNLNFTTTTAAIARERAGRRGSRPAPRHQRPQGGDDRLDVSVQSRRT